MKPTVTKRKKSSTLGDWHTGRRRKTDPVPTLTDVQPLDPQRRVMSTTHWISSSSGLSSSTVSTYLPQEAAPSPRILFTPEELAAPVIPTWTENEDELVGQIDGELVGQIDDDAFSDSSRANSFNRPPEDPMKTWHDDLDHYLDEMIQLEGRGPYSSQTTCAECRVGIPEFRCQDCFTGELFCSGCLVNIHNRNPLHRIEGWKDPGFFKPTTLCALGLRIQLGHVAGEKCMIPIPATNFTIMDTYSIQEVSMDFCGCETAIGHVDQLLQASLYPATTKQPRTAATFTLLKRYQLLSFESKCSAYQYYCSIMRESDNTGISDIKARYREFLRMTRCWAALKTFKRAGRGHHPLGTTGTELGECALLCPACPHPDINLPKGWQDAPENEQWLYTLYLAIDANFRLRRKHVSSEDKDPAISNGYGYFVKTKPYLEHLEKCGGQKQEPSKCVSHDAVNSADTRESLGCAVTGCGAVDCARHEFRRPNSIGDLQKGERYINMDYLFYSSLATASLKRLVVSYDIACQWRMKFSERMSQKFPPNWFVNNNLVKIKFLVPKFHLPAHVDKCHRDYSFNFTKGVGRTDGEGVERGWARINDLAGSTREMGPGSRRDKLESHMGDSNWKKKIKMGVSLLEKLKVALSSRSEHAAQLSRMEQELEQEWLDEWRREVETWEDDPSKANPYEPRIKDMSQNDVRLMLAKQDAETQYNDLQAPGVTASGMLILGLELEDAQTRLREEMASTGLHPTVLQQAKFQERCNTLSRRLDSWYPVQAYFIPGVTLLRTLDAQRTSSEPKVFNRRLYLPSEIMKLEPQTAATHVTTSLLETEWLLREAQAKDCLNSLRSHLRVDSYLMRYKQVHVRGVAENTRSQVLIKQNLSKVKSATKKYRRAYDALLALEEPLQKSLSWRDVLQPLNDKDVVGLPVGGVGEGNKTLSWIWLAAGVAEAGNGERSDKVHDVLRIQWLRARARVNRWSEEILLLLEEMRRVSTFLKYESDWWNKRSGIRMDVSVKLREGLVAYAHHQSHICMELRDRFLEGWAKVGNLVAQEGVKLK